MRHDLLSVFSTLTAIAALLFATTANAGHFKQSSSGWVVNTAVDANGNGRTQSINTTFGKGTFGETANNTTSETQFVSVGPSCGALPAEVFAAKLQFTSSNVVMRFENGDLLFAALDTSDPPSLLCVGLSQPGNSSEVNLVITGGTGKFEGATGWLNTKSRATPLPSASDESGQRGISRVTTGEIFHNRLHPLHSDD